jgi:hypothetical protein
MNKAELLEEAKNRGLSVNTRTSKAELESMLDDGRLNPTTENTTEGQDRPEVQNKEEVRVNENQDGAATNGTTQHGSDKPVDNTTSVPQNGVDTVNTLKTTDNEIAKRADESRETQEVEFADQSNPNQKARVAGALGEEYDQDGNLRTGGYSYGVAEDDTKGTVPEEQNKGTAPEDLGPRTDILDNRAEPIGRYLNPEANSDADTNAREWSTEDQFDLEKRLSDPDNGVMARVTTSAGNYVRVKFFRNNKPLTTFRSRNFKEEDAVKARDNALEERGFSATA